MDLTPYRDDVADLVKASHEQKTVCQLVNGATTWDVTLLSGSLKLSEDWSPFAQLSGTIANSFTTAELAQLDPRLPLTVNVSAGYVHPDGFEDVHGIFTGQLEERKVRNPAGVIDLKASSAELFAVEARYLAADTWKTFTGINEAIKWFAEYVNGGVPVTLNSHLPAAYRADIVTSIPVMTGDVIWEIMDDIVTTLDDVRLYVDTDGTWTIAPKNKVAGVTDAFLTTGGGGVVDNSTDTLTRDGYAAAAAIKFKWKDAGGVDRTMTGLYGTAGTKTFSAERKRAVTQLQATAAARATVKMLSTRGNSFELEAVAAYWLRPGDTVQVTLASGAEARHIVKAVTFNLNAGTMRVETREPSNIT